jgi:hypothetical protein
MWEGVLCQRTPAIRKWWQFFIAGVNDTTDKFFTVLTIRQQCLRPPGSDAADGVIVTTMKRCINSLDTPHTLIRGPWGRKTTSNLNGDISGRRSRTQQPPIVSFEPSWKDASIDTPHTLITDVVVTGDHWKSVTRINFRRCRWYREQVIVGVVDTGDKHSFENISANFQKNLKWPQGNTHGRGTLIHEKTLSRNSRVRLPLNKNLQDN